VRVIAGRAKGAALKSIPASTVRPSGGRLKEALFSTLGEGIAGKRILDLYAGSGALGIEALSRGAAAATFVESDPLAASAIEQNLVATRLAERATVVRSTVERFAASGTAEPFDLVLADPPYASGLPEGILGLMAERGLIGPDSLVVVEVASRATQLFGDGFGEVSRRRYGDSTLVYLRPGGAG
jgi:16S rRNA (guanine966-N2)-methyltransferase